VLLFRGRPPIFLQLGMEPCRLATASCPANPLQDHETGEDDDGDEEPVGGEPWEQGVLREHSGDSTGMARGLRKA